MTSPNIEKSCLKWPSTVNLGKTERWALGGCYIFCSIFAAIGNSLVIYAVVRTRRLRSKSNLLLVNLCIADLLVGIVAEPLSVYVLWYEIKRHGNCTFESAVAFAVSFSCSASVLLLCFLSFDRYVRIVRSTKYNSVMKTHTIVISVSSLWIMACVIGIMFITNVSHIDVALVTIALTCFAIMVGLYTRIFRAVFKHSRTVMSYSDDGPSSLNNPDRPPTPNPRPNSSKGSKRAPFQGSKGISFQIHVAKSLLIVIVAFFLCWMPFLAVLTTRRVLIGQHSDIDTSVYHWCLCAAYFNSALNPILYNARNRGIRGRIKKMLRCVDVPITNA